MGFFGKLANIFGIGDSDEVLEDTPKLAGDASAAEPQPAPVAAAQPLSTDKERVDAIFERVVGVFNTALPDFLQRSVDPEKQRRCLYDALDASMCEYLESLTRAADLNAKASWQAEHERLVAEAASLKKKAADLESAKSDIKDKQLSAERQRRALSERVRDLEEQVMKLEAEKEQFEIENKCMLNKAKASAVLEAEIEDLRSRMGQPDAGNAASEALEAANAKIAVLEAEAAGMREKIENLSQGAKVKDEVGDAMLNELQAKAAEATAGVSALKKQLEEKAAEVELIEAKLEDAKKLAEEKEFMCEMLKSEAEEKESKIKELEDTVDDLKNQLADDEETQQEMAEIQKQIELFEQVKLKMDSRVEKLKASLQASQSENESLRDTIRENLIEHARVQKELNDRIDELDAEVNHKTRQIDIDFSDPAPHPLADADWLVSTPPADSSMRVEDPADFGYQPPKIKPRPETEDHPSLFD